MLYQPAELALLAVIMTVGSVVQGAVGFASGLLGVPLLVLSGFSLLEAATVNLVSAGVQNILGASTLSAHLEARELALPVAVRSVSIPLGALALMYVQELDPARAKQLIGVLLLMIVLLLGALRVRPRDHIPLGWQLAAFSSSGFMLGLASIGGAPMVLYVNSLTWSANKSRAFLFFCSATGAPLMALILVWRFGAEIVPPVASTVAILPAILAGLWVGLQLGNRLNKHVFRRLTFILLTCIAITAILGPILTGG